jgi:hypothetical protein
MTEPSLDTSVVVQRTSQTQRKVALFLAHGFLELDPKENIGNVQALGFCSKTDACLDIEES